MYLSGYNYPEATFLETPSSSGLSSVNSDDSDIYNIRFFLNDSGEKYIFHIIFLIILLLRLSPLTTGRINFQKIFLTL